MSHDHQHLLSQSTSKQDLEANNDGRILEIINLIRLVIWVRKVSSIIQFVSSKTGDRIIITKANVVGKSTSEFQICANYVNWLPELANIYQTNYTS